MYSEKTAYSTPTHFPRAVCTPHQRDALFPSKYCLGEYSVPLPARLIMKHQTSTLLCRAMASYVCKPRALALSTVFNGHTLGSIMGGCLGAVHAKLDEDGSTGAEESREWRCHVPFHQDLSEGQIEKECSHGMLKYATKTGYGGYKATFRCLLVHLCGAIPDKGSECVIP